MQLNEDTSRKLRYTVTSAGWEEVIEPTLRREHHAAIAQLVDPRETRPNPKYSDEFLRGYIKGLEFFRQRWLSMADEYDVNKQTEEAQANGAEAVAGSPYVDPE